MVAFFDLVGALFNLLTAVMKFIVLLLQLAVAGVLEDAISVYISVA